MEGIHTESGLGKISSTTFLDLAALLGVDALSGIEETRLEVRPGGCAILSP